MDVVARLEVLQRHVAEPVVRHPGQVDDGREVGHREVADLHGVAVYQCGRTDQRVVTVPAGDLVEGHPRAPRQGREERRDRDLVVVHARLERTDVQLVGGDGAASARALDVERAAEQDEHDRHLRGGVGVHEGPDGGAAVADGGVGDVGQSHRDERLHPAYVGVGEYVGVPGQCPDGDARLLGADGVEARQPVDVDQHRGRGQPHRQQRHQALAAGQDLCPRITGQGRHRIGERPWSAICEGGWFHGSSWTPGFPTASMVPSSPLSDETARARW